MSDPASLPTPPVPLAPILSLESASDHLTIPQRHALSALIAGQPLKAAAHAAGVHRATLHRWLTSNPCFRAAYNAWQHEARESTTAKLLSVANDALNAVTTAIQNGNHRLAYSLLKDLGLLSKIQPGLTDPNLLTQQIQLEHASQKHALDTQSRDLQVEPPNPD